MSWIKRITLSILGIIILCLVCVGGINIADKFGMLPVASPTVRLSDTPVILPIESPTVTPILVTVVMDNEPWVVTPSPTNTPTNTPSTTPTATPTLITILLPIIANAPSPTPPVIAGVACIPRNTLQQSGVVVDVIDGDTIEVQIAGTNYRVRYIGIDTPEANPPFREWAKAKNAELVSGKTVLLVKDVSETDRFDRLLRYVIVDNVFVNQVLVSTGYAVAKDYPPDTACSIELDSAQKHAEGNSLGVWAPQPTSEAPSRSGGAPVGEPACQCTGNLYNCKDFTRQSEAQACFNYCISQGLGDIHRLDGDSDGRVCESLP